MTKEKQVMGTRPQKKNGRRSENNRRSITESEEPLPLDLQRLIGNRATQRTLQRGYLEGSIPTQGLTLEQIRKAAVAQALGQTAAQAGLAPGIQREEEGGEEVVTLDTQAGTQTGQVTIEEPQLEEYEVSGSTLEEVGGQLDPEEWGRCTWKVDYDYETQNGKATKVNITLHLNIRMPKWTDSGNASEAARKEWQRMLTALRRHEDGHADIARKWAPIFKDRLVGQSEGTLTQKYNKALKELNDEEKKFDTDTSHGQNQGVSLDTSIQ